MGLFNSFGKNPSAQRANHFISSPNFKHGAFHNLSETPMMLKGSFARNVFRFFNKPRNTAPSIPLPSVKTDLESLSYTQPVIIWFGHSSYLIRIDGMNILVDPVLSGYASPFSFGVKSFRGADVYTADELPTIDLLILTHDHYDHLDHRTLLKLKPKIKAICTSAGVGSHLTFWGLDPAIITEFDWWESRQLLPGIEIIAAPARHFSGRTFKRAQTLWSSFILRTDQYRIYIGADSGYDTHFKKIGEQFGPFDIALLETGQYNEDWPLIHMAPEEAVQASIDLRAKWMMPVHWAKFALAYHPWSEPAERVLSRARELNVKVTTPRIGEPVVLESSYPNAAWWRPIG